LQRHQFSGERRSAIDVTGKTNVDTEIAAFCPPQRSQVISEHRKTRSRYGIIFRISHQYCQSPNFLLRLCVDSVDLYLRGKYCESNQSVASVHRVNVQRTRNWGSVGVLATAGEKLGH
jgi:hypothetical protein